MPAVAAGYQWRSWRSAPRSAAFILNKVEKGAPGVSMGIYATVLFVLGMADRVGMLADARSDTLGLELEEEHLPQRIRNPRQTKPASAD